MEMASSIPAPGQLPASHQPHNTAAAAAQPGPSASPGPSSAASPSPNIASSSGTQHLPTFGPHMWQEQRKQWRQATKDATPLKRDIVIPATATYEDLLLSNEYFDESIPLAEMVEFLVDAWIQDGLYD